MNTIARPTISRTCAALLIAAAASSGAVAQGRQDPGQIMSAKDAHAKAIAGEVVLVDIRTPDEWRETGIPASAKAITMHQEAPKLFAQLAEATGGDKSKPIALICRTGNRTSFLQAELRKVGYTSVLNVAEGVAGGPFGQGWVKGGLPLRKP